IGKCICIITILHTTIAERFLQMFSHLLNFNTPYGSQRQSSLAIQGGPLIRNDLVAPPIAARWTRTLFMD
ncbi:unnamed protein product, partial [Ceratitis capitata]